MSETIETLIGEYRAHAAAHGKATLGGDYKSANHSHDKLVALVPQIRGFGSSGEKALLELSSDPDDAVACWAATHSLGFNAASAMGVLGTISKKSGPIGFSAKMVLQQWAKGKLKV